jgi:hypothetical protein
MDHQPLQHIFVTAQVHSSHSAALVQMGIHALPFLPALPLQPTAALTSHSPPIPVHCSLLTFWVAPVLPPSLRLRDVGADGGFFHFSHHPLL